MNSDVHDHELWLSHYSCADWCDPNRWSTYFERAQKILGAEISHLDENDPIRRRFDNKPLLENARYVVEFGEQEESRILFGELATIGVDFSLHLYRNDPRWHNSIDWHGPPEMFDDPAHLNKVYELFDCGNGILSPFYSYADTREIHVRKKWRKEFGGVDFQEELLGIYWLTHFNDRYVDFFGRDKLESLGDKEVEVKLADGVTLRLAEKPSAVPEGLRQTIENDLGPRSFVAWQRDITVKRPGQYALTFEQLRQ